MSNPIVCEPLHDGIKLVERLQGAAEGSSCLVLFYHGLGDLVMFLAPYRALQAQFPGIRFSLGLPNGLKYEQIVSEAVLLEGDAFNAGSASLPYDLVVKIHFPMNEGQQELTKGEWCCVHELGIPPVAGHRLPKPDWPSPLVAVSYQITCLPESANAPPDIAERIWNEILEAGFVPLECHFQHIFANPVNTKYPFVDATVRRARADVSSLVGLLQSARAFVGVVSGPFHVALSVLPPDRIMLLEKDFKRGSFTKLPIATCDLRDYQGEVQAWLSRLS